MMTCSRFHCSGRPVATQFGHGAHRFDLRRRRPSGRPRRAARGRGTALRSIGTCRKLTVFERRRRNSSASRPTGTRSCSRPSRSRASSKPWRRCIDPPLTVAHRFVESEAGLAHYAKRPGGVMWRQRELFDAPVFYLAFHGRPGGFASTLGRIGAARPVRGLRRLRRLPQPGLFRRLQRAARRARPGVREAVPQGERRARGDRLHHAGELDGQPGRRPAVPAPLLQRPLAVAQPAAHPRSVLRDYPRAKALGYTLVTD